VERAGKDVEKVLQRHLIVRGLLAMKNSAAVEYLQAFIPFALSRNRICKTFQIFLPALSLRVGFMVPAGRSFGTNTVLPPSKYNLHLIHF